MAFTAHLMENFMEWATGVLPGSIPGTGWSPASGTAPQVTANANFASGKCVRWLATNALSSDLAFPAGVPLGVPWGLQFNTIRQADNTNSDPTSINAGQGIVFLTGLSGYWLRIVQGQSSVALQNSWYLQSRAGDVSTFQTLAISENKYLLGTKHTMSINVDWTTGTFEWWIDEELIFTFTSVDFAGATPTGFRWGRMGTAASSGSSDISDIILYSDAAFTGPLEIRSGFVTADDALQDWAFVGGASAWESINNLYSAAPTQYIESATLGDISDFVCPLDATNVVSILSVSSEVFAVRTDISPIDMQARIGQGIAFTNGPTINPPQATYEKFRTFFDIVNPNTGVNWVPADLPNILVGVERTS